MTADIAVSASHLSKRYRILRRGEVPVTSAEALLQRLRRNRKRPEFFDALQDVSFEVPWGASVGIVGRNGAGKSTLLKILTRITAPTAGHAEVGGRVGSLLEVGTGFHPELTGRENIYLNGTLLGMRRRDIQRHFDDIVEFAGVERFLDTQVKRYSTGMYIRLAFGVAAHLDSEILVVDEVLAVGDAEFQAKCIQKMREVARSGRTVFLVSHQIHTVSALATSALYLKSGRLEYQGDLEGALAAYRASFEQPTPGELDAAMRPGSGDLRFEHLRAAKQAFEPDEEKVIEFSTNANAAQRGLFYLEIDILDENRVLVAQCDSRLSKFWIEPDREMSGILRLKTPWLKPGSYLIDAYLNGSQIADTWEGATRFEVLPDLPYSGDAPPNAIAKAPVIADFSFETEVI